MAIRLSSFFAWFNRQNTSLLIFILCLVNFTAWHPTGDEERCFSLARQFMDPVWMPNSFTLNHPAGANFIFQVIVGFLLKYVSFEQMTLFGRTLNFLLYAIPLGLFFRKLKMTNIEVIFLLQVLYFGHQSLYAGEWIFNSLEEKTLAYIFVFWSLYYLVSDKPLWSAVSAAIATYFHFLTGGWIFIFIILYFFFARRNILKGLYSAFAYALIVAPFVLYLYNTYIVNNPTVINGVNTNAIYAFWRFKHHIGIFHNARHFFSHSFLGVFITLIMFGLCVFRFSKIKNRLIHDLNILNIIIFSQQLICMIIEVFDRNAVFSRTYPFSTQSISLLLFLTELVFITRLYLSKSVFTHVFKRIAQKDRHLHKVIFNNAINGILLITTLVVLFFETRNTIHNFNLNRDLDDDMASLISYARENTPGWSVFIFPDSDRPYSFIRKSERERFVVKKFTPVKSATISEWYQRCILKERLRNDINLIDSLKTVYQINYMVTDSAYDHPSLIPEKTFGLHKLYRISND